jgi:hypothetical protein
MKSGRYYKIGRSNTAGRRECEVAIQMPEKLVTVPTIRTGDPQGSRPTGIDASRTKGNGAGGSTWPRPTWQHSNGGNLCERADLSVATSTDLYGGSKRMSC